jgi:hypothetical protein|nr:MAG TPA: hypothetical protein [Caudoviricetes sp.]
MIINKIPSAGKEKLYQSLYSYTSSLIKRGVSIQCIAHSDKYGAIDIQVNGKRGIVRKNIVVAYDTAEQLWLAINDGYECKMYSLSDVTVVVRSAITKLSSLVSKL